MLPVINWELRQRRTSIIWWSIGVAAMIAMLMLLYPSIRDQAAELNKALNQLPDSLKSLRTGGSQVDITSPIGFLNSQLYYVTLPLLLGILTIGLGSSLLAKEEQSHTLELPLSRPISRTRLLLAKAVAGLLIVGIVGAVMTLVTVAFAKIVEMDIDLGNLLLTSLLTTLFAASFGVIAYAFTAVGTQTHRLSIAIAVLVSFGGYIIKSLSGLTDWLETVVKVIPYHYFNPTELLQGNVSTGLLVYLIVTFVIGGIAAWLGFRRRDIN